MSQTTTTEEILTSGFIVYRNDLDEPSYRGEFEEIIIFATEKEAWDDIDDCIEEIKRAIKRKDMSKNSKETRNDYKVLPAFVKNPTADIEEQILVYTLFGEQVEFNRVDN